VRWRCHETRHLLLLKRRRQQPWCKLQSNGHELYERAEGGGGGGRVQLQLAVTKRVESLDVSYKRGEFAQHRRQVGRLGR
jgi:hypothetical protein